MDRLELQAKLWSLCSINPWHTATLTSQARNETHCGTSPMLVFCDIWSCHAFPLTGVARRASYAFADEGRVGVKTTGIDSIPLTKFAGRSGNVVPSASRRSGKRWRIRAVIVDSSRRAS